MKPDNDFPPEIGEELRAEFEHEYKKHKNGYGQWLDMTRLPHGGYRSMVTHYAWRAYLHGNGVINPNTKQPIADRTVKPSRDLTGTKFTFQEFSLDKGEKIYYLKENIGDVWPLKVNMFSEKSIPLLKAFIQWSTENGLTASDEWIDITMEKPNPSERVLCYFQDDRGQELIEMCCPVNKDGVVFNTVRLWKRISKPNK